MSEYITPIIDIDKYLCQFIPIKDLLNVTQINKSLNNLVQELKIIIQYSGFKSVEGISLLGDFTYMNGYVELLDHLYKHKRDRDLKYTRVGIAYALKNNHVQIFEWFHKNNIKYKYFDESNQNDNVMNNMLIQNNLKTINWLKKYEPRFIELPIISELYSFQKYMLKKDVAYEIKTVKFHYELIMVCVYGLIDVLDEINKFDNNMLKQLIQSANYFDTAILFGQIQVFEWFHVNHHECIFDFIRINAGTIIHCNRYSMIKWFVDHNYKFDDIDNLIKLAQDKNRLNIVELLQTYANSVD